MRDLSDIIVNRRPPVMPASASVMSACCAMRDAGAGSVLVTTDEGRLAGIFTGRDAIVRVLAAGRGDANPRVPRHH